MDLFAVLANYPMKKTPCIIDVLRRDLGLAFNYIWGSSGSRNFDFYCSLPRAFYCSLSGAFDAITLLITLYCANLTEVSLFMFEPVEIII